MSGGASTHAPDLLGLSRPASRAAASPPPGGPTAREREVLRFLAQGLTYDGIAAALVISPHTVNRHLTAIYTKLGVTSRHAATRWAIDHHLD